MIRVRDLDGGSVCECEESRLRIGEGVDGVPRHVLLERLARATVPDL